MKGKFDFKELMVQRGEIFVMGAVLLMVGYFVYDAFGYNVLKDGREPEDLANRIEDARGVIEGPKGPVDIDIIAADMTHALIAASAFPPHEFTPREFENKKKRGELIFFAMEGPRACAGIGPFAVKPVRGAREPAAAKFEFRDLAKDRTLPGFRAGGKADARLMRYIVLTGLVPIFKQQASFDLKLKGAVLPPGHALNKDVLEYGPPQIERAEVTAAGASALSWAPLSQADITRGLEGDPDWVAARGGGNNQDIGAAAMDPKFANPVFTSPLGPLLMKDWTEECVLHAPEIPRRVAEVPANDEVAKVDDGRPAPKGLFGEEPDEPDEQEVVPDDGQDAEAIVQYQLFRFFDYTVEPGKSYVYRVKLHMINPNFGIELRFLAKPEVQTLTRYSDSWSETSPVASVPTSSEVLAGSLKAGAGGDRARMMVIDRNPKTGLEGHKEMTRRVGHLAHFPLAMDVNARVEDAWYVDPDAPDERQPRKRKISWTLAGEVLVLDPLRQKIRVEPTFTSDVALLDVRGGTGQEPAEILVMDGLGRLSAHHAAADHAEFQRRNAYVSAAGIKEVETDSGTSTNRFGD